MACARCGGLTIEERYTDQGSMFTDREFSGQRCVNCGAIDDRVIRYNRIHPPIVKQRTGRLSPAPIPLALTQRPPAA